MKLSNCGAGEDSWDFLELQGQQTNQSYSKSILNIHWKYWYWRCSSNALATLWKELTHWKRPWCWERLKAGGKGDHRGWDGWMALPTWYTWVCTGSTSWWCHPTISSSVIPVSTCLYYFPASGSFPMSRFFTSGDQGIGGSASASVFPMNIQDWVLLGLAGWISLQSKGLSRVFSSTTLWKYQFFDAQLSL